MIGAAVTLGVLALTVIAAALYAWWRLLNADHQGISPTNDIKELNREDGGVGPI